MDGGGQAIGTTVQLGGACMDKLRKMVYDSRKEGQKWMTGTSKSLTTASSIGM